MKAFSQAWRTMRRSPYQSLTAIMVVFTTFLLIFVVSSAMKLGEVALSYFETQPAITVFLNVEVDDDAAATLAGKIAKWENVTDLRVIDKESAFKIYSEANADEPLLLELLGAELFPVSLTLSASSPEFISPLQEKLLALPEVDDIAFNNDVYNDFLSWTRVLRLVGGGLCAVMLVQLILVLIVIMTMMVSGKRESIKILRIIGATRGMVKTPFVVEGMLFGLVGSVFAFGIVHGLLLYFGSGVSKFFGEIVSLPLAMDFVIWQGAIGVVGAMVLGVLSASIAADRFARRHR